MALLLPGAIALAGAVARSDYITRAGLTPRQPVPFSHRHHVKALGIDCRFCHNSVEVSARAGLPPTYTCMTCHSQIWTNAKILAPVRKSLASGRAIEWRRVARLPDYVYFQHDIHIAKGVGCVVCHGRIDEMPLTYRAIPFEMKFCIDCHRDPAPRLRPREFVTDMNWKPAGDARAQGEKLIKKYGIRIGELTYCTVCHR